MGVSYTRWRVLTYMMTVSSTSSGMSCGSTVMPPRRATVSAIRRPATAVMLATTTGMVVPSRSGVVRSTSKRDATSLRLGTMNTSLYVRSYGGVLPRNCIVGYCLRGLRWCVLVPVKQRPKATVAP
jgi:hypothetical protein